MKEVTDIKLSEKSSYLIIPTHQLKVIFTFQTPVKLLTVRKRSGNDKELNGPFSPWVGKKKKRSGHIAGQRSSERGGDEQKRTFSWDRLKKSSVAFDWDRLKKSDPVAFDWDRLKKSDPVAFDWDRLKRSSGDTFHWDRLKREAIFDSDSKREKNIDEGFLWDRI